MNEISTLVKNRFKDVTLDVESEKIVSIYKKRKHRKVAALAGAVSCFVIALTVFIQFNPKSVERLTIATEKFLSNLFSESTLINVAADSSISTSPQKATDNCQSSKPSKKNITTSGKNTSSYNQSVEPGGQTEPASNTQKGLINSKTSTHSKTQSTKTTEPTKPAAKPNSTINSDNNNSAEETTALVSDGVIYTSGNYKYTLFNNGTAEIHEYFGNSKSNISIPDKLDGHIVTSIGYAAFYCHPEFTNVTISDNITNIGESAFEFCSHITSINIPDSVTNIGKSAFQACSRLSNIKIGNGLTIIDADTFKYCKTLKTVTIGKNVKRICEGAFHSCRYLTKITIPANVTAIENFAMGYYKNNNTKIKDFTIVGYTKTEAENYANNNGFAFKVID